MGKKGRLIFGILILVLVPAFAFVIWKETENDGENYLEKELNKKTLPSIFPAQNAAAQPKVQNKIEPQNIPNPAPPENPTETKNEETPKKEADPAKNNSEDVNNYKNDNLGISFDYSKEYAVAFDGNKTITISKGNVSWKIRFYDNKNKEDIQVWFGNKFDKGDNLDCSFADPEIKAGAYEGKLVKPVTDAGKCADAGNYAINSDKNKVIKISEGKETKENINKILESFKFL